ncbi:MULTISPECIES: SDR family oxidoreductase [Sphingobacterium]|uniref:SDR family oxidoreductase n=1 Tax=Sphingobacterium TaxID=28453 RepID=UPI001046599D|nr:MULTISPECIES: SDR family oxidoreductase [Sphingobacterium]MCW2259808.1 NAD(P)-dependent dehydrogenase (short-subunit alcohol dehydrogenase family) [Sphingobacterium kitahiroshimense]TCR03352.1 NADP-dependent 3-hydroxy acid dehydrogenase YdfG [Sphingobacterium sp. JUb78]
MQKTIFITGASAGLGKATAKLFQSKGWNVIASMRSPEKETELNLLENITIVKLDVNDAEAIANTVKAVTENYTIDVVFNNAGYGLSGAFEHATDEQIVKQIETNLTGVIRVTKSFLPYFKLRKNGLFITTTSIFGFSSGPMGSVYNATKWALEGFSESISYELSLFNIGIKTIAPGGIKSNFINGIDIASAEGYEMINDQMWKQINDGTFIKFTEPEEIAGVVLEAATDGKDQLRYLAGDDAIKTFNKRMEIGAENFRIEMRTKLGLLSPF